MGGLVPGLSTIAGPIDQIFMVVLVLTGIAFVLVEGILIYFLIRYRHREDRKATYIHGDRRVEIFGPSSPG